MERSLDLITSFLANPGLEKTRPRGITQKEPSSLILCLMSLGSRMRTVISCKGFKCVTLWEEVLDMEWEPS